MKKVEKRLRQRFMLFKVHPVTRGRAWFALFRYIKFHVLASVCKELTYKWIGSLRFSVSKGDAGMVGNIYYGLYEFEESIFLLHVLRSKDVFLDVGANMGHYALLTSGMCLNKSIAVEPVPGTVSKLKKQVALNKLESLIVVKHMGVAEKSGCLWFSTNRGTMDRIVGSSYSNAVSVNVEPIDTLLKDEVPLAIKIDVEGYEWYALQGAKEILENKHLKIVILELNNSSRFYKITDDDVYHMMLDYDFKPYRYEATLRRLILLENYNKDTFNTLFIRDASFVEKRLKSAKPIKIMGRMF